MKSYASTAQSMTDVTAVIEHARIEGRDLATALRIARATLVYVSGSMPDADQSRALAEMDRHLRVNNSPAAPDAKHSPIDE